jgi:hypothetical protein
MPWFRLAMYGFVTITSLRKYTTQSLSLRLLLDPARSNRNKTVRFRYERKTDCRAQDFGLKWQRRHESANSGPLEKGPVRCLHPRWQQSSSL